MKRLIALLAAAAALIAGLLVAGSPTPASAGITNLGSLSAAPATSNLGTAVTVTPSAPCPQQSTDVQVTYTLNNNELVDDVTIPVDENGNWSDTVTMDAAGQYLVDAICTHANPTAGHLAAGGLFQIDGQYDTDDFQVNGLVVAAPNPATSGQSVTFTPTFTDPAVGSRCPGGDVTITITDPDGRPVVTGATPTVASDGSWALAQILTKVGNYTVTGTCARTLPNIAAGHLGVAPPLTNDFTYSGTATVQAAATTTTTTAPAAAAEAVEATPTFTG
jgi:hypothetical protein